MMSILNKNSIFLIIIILMSSFAFIYVNSTNIEPASEDQTRFISFGDSPHVPEGEVENYLKMLIDSINDHNSSLIIHIGDTLGGREACTDSMILLHLKLMNRLDAPVLYTPGDNEWRDCYQEKKGVMYDNLERLDYIRNTHFSNNKTLGKNPIFVENFSENGYPENARIILNNIAFITAHLVGSNNNYDPTNLRNTNEYYERDLANIEWIKESFKNYDKANAFVVAIHADMYSNGLSISSEYKNFAMALYSLSNEFKKPVLILYGDSHKFKDFKPMPKKYPYIHAINNYGNPDIKALMIEVDPYNKEPFKVIKVIKGESLKTWLFRNFQRTINYLDRVFQRIHAYFK